MKRHILQTMRHAMLAAAAVVVFYPILFAIFSALLKPEEADLYPPRLFPSSFYFGNFVKVLESLPIGAFLFNSFIIAVIVMVGQWLTSSMAAYAFSFLKFPGRSILFSIFLSTMMIPWEITMIPNYLTVRSLGWTDSYAGLTVPFLAGAFGTFMLRQYFLQLPRELFEAAKIDGCGHLRIFLTMVLPLSRPVFATLGVYVFLNTWNMYLWPLLITNKPAMRTAQIGISMLQMEETVSWNLILAGVTIVLLPSLLLLVFGLKQLVNGITSGAVKG